MNYTLKQLQDKVSRMIEQQGEDAECAAWIYTKEDIQAQINFLACMRERQRMTDDERSGQSLFDEMFGG